MEQITLSEDYVSFEVAKLLKEKGFDETCYACYEYFSSSVTMYSGWPFEYKGEVVNNSNDRIKCPTHQMVMKWLREVHNICITIYPDKENGYEAVLYNIKDDVEIILQSFGIYGSHIFEDSYEEAVEAACLYSLKNLI